MRSFLWQSKTYYLSLFPFSMLFLLPSPLFPFSSALLVLFLISGSLCYGMCLPMQYHGEALLSTLLYDCTILKWIGYENKVLPIFLLRK